MALHNFFPEYIWIKLSSIHWQTIGQDNEHKQSKIIWISTHIDLKEDLKRQSCEIVPHSHVHIMK